MGALQQSIVSRIAHETLRQSPKNVTSGDWWSHLGDDFADHPENFQLGVYDASRVQVTALVDVAVRTVGAIGVGLTAFPVGFRPSKLKKMLAHRNFYEPIAQTGNPNIFFATPPKNVELKV